MAAPWLLYKILLIKSNMVKFVLKVLEGLLSTRSESERWNEH